MANINELLNKLPYDQIAAKTGQDPETIRSASEGVLNSLLMGMGANAQDPAGRDSLAQAVQDHDPKLVQGDVNVDQIDTTDGEKITTHIFGQNKDQVTEQLGGALGGNDLIRQLLPLLAPIALAWLAEQMQQKGAPAPAPSDPAPTTPAPENQTQSQGGLLEQILQQVIGGGQAQAPSQGGLLQQILGGLLGGGRR